MLDPEYLDRRAAKSSVLLGVVGVGILLGVVDRFDFERRLLLLLMGSVYGVSTTEPSTKFFISYLK